MMLMTTVFGAILLSINIITITAHSHGLLQSALNALVVLLCKDTKITQIKAKSKVIPNSYNLLVQTYQPGEFSNKCLFGV